MLDMVSANITPHFKHHPYWCGAMLEGVRYHGHETSIHTSPETVQEEGPIICWGLRNAAPFLKQNRDTLILECGYIGDRTETWASAGWNGLNGRAKFPEIYDDSRLQRYHPDLIQPWDDCPIGVALIVGQVPGDQSLIGLNFDKWRKDAEDFFDARGTAHRFRPHPKCNITPSRSRQEDLDDALFSLTLNSNFAVDSILAGTPAITMDVGSMAWEVSAHSLDSELIRPDRHKWASHLAWCQWTVEEMRDGTAWESLRSLRTGAN